MAILGAHMSVAGGLYKAIESAVALKMDTVQIFTSSPSQWSAKPLEADAIEHWHRSWKASGLTSPIAHSSYLINIASAEPLFRKSVDALVDQWQRCEALHLTGLVLHPGAYTTSTEAEGLQRAADGIVEAIQRVKPVHCRLLLENTAGQGTCLGHRIEHLGQIIELATGQNERFKKHLGVCIDTCHAFAAGYAIHRPDGLQSFCDELCDRLPADAVRAVHLNDSKKPLGSRVDRHEHIGRGEIGTAAFRRILNDSSLAAIPGYLETEKGCDEATGLEWDAINLKTLRRLTRAATCRRS
ncbi:MAG: deoxyribonuclease IV [Planctomycetaceae bacterium]